MKIKLPNDIEVIFIINPLRDPKKNPDPNKIIKPPGNENVKKIIENIK